MYFSKQIYLHICKSQFPCKILSYKCLPIGVGTVVRIIEVGFLLFELSCLPIDSDKRDFTVFTRLLVIIVIQNWSTVSCVGGEVNFSDFFDLAQCLYCVE